MVIVRQESERVFQQGVNKIEGKPEMERHLELAIRRMRYVLEALESPGKEVIIPETHDRDEISAFSVEAMRRTIPAPLCDSMCEIQVGEDDRPSIVLANGSVIKCSTVEWYPREE